MFDEESVWATKDAEDGAAALERSDAACSIMGGYLGRLLAEFEDRQTIAHLLPKLLTQQRAEVTALERLRQEAATKLGALSVVERALADRKVELGRGKRQASENFSDRELKSARTDVSHRPAADGAKGGWDHPGQAAAPDRGHTQQSDLDERLQRMQSFTEGTVREHKSTDRSNNSWQSSQHTTQQQNHPRRPEASDSSNHHQRAHGNPRDSSDLWSPRPPPGGPRGPDTVSSSERTTGDPVDPSHRQGSGSSPGPKQGDEPYRGDGARAQRATAAETVAPVFPTQGNSTAPVIAKASGRLR